jgi:diguanylate cyclase (GGDEF)-like protein/PAS domain S-box-containing protein
MAVFRGVRARADRDAMLRRDHDFLAAVMDTAGALVIVTDREGAITRFNRACERTTGFAAADVLGRPPWETLVDPAEAELVRERFAAVSGATFPNRYDGHLVARDGSRRLIEWTNTALLDGRGEPEHIIATGIDVTERRAAEAALRESEGALVALLEQLRAINRARDPRHPICEAAVELAFAEGASLFEPGPDGLRVTAEAGALDVPIAPAELALSSGEPQRAELLLARGGTGTAVYEPLVVGGRALGVLAVAWARPQGTVPPRHVTAAALLGTEAAGTLERADEIARLDAEARTDELTSVANRRAWEEALPAALAAADRLDAPLAVVMLDLDLFKDYNDRHGHQAGDRLLRSAVAAWSDHLRPHDLLARYGGEEFAIMLPGCGADEAAEVVERLRGATPHGQTCSGGLAVWDGVESGGALLRRADVALYAAKDAGRNRLVTA